MVLLLGLVLVVSLVLLGIVLRIMGSQPPRCSRCRRAIATPLSSTLSLGRSPGLVGGRRGGADSLSSPVLCGSCNRWFCRACWLTTNEVCPGCGSTDVVSTLDSGTS